MLVKTKGKLLNRNHIWFEKINQISELDSEIMDCDEVIIHGNNTSFSGKRIKTFTQNSLITDLSLNEDELIKHFSKTVRNEINRSQKEGVKPSFFFSNDILEKDSLIREFESMYVSMYKEKGMKGVHLDKGEIRGYCQNDSFVLSGAQISDNIVVYHSYVYNNCQCRLLHSCSEFRVQDSSVKNAIGRANKYLHWEDMLFFKHRGITKYDWGGISSFSEPNGIDKFKMSFGGEPVSYYNIHVACSLRQRILRG